ncbi:hypothetical protein L198_07031 [Cryptococcus wingfieldii CBS 7118]|uniref:Uncharacterized protein n=1 Tax=Cryptococcus wingfieldii CBS 7118 TaxID=1295528 RepID=A0A1E3IFN5_9TREE|nr:hypothetical protein L198_07031 [Cryptococcus wingfieldii CBS 7118]ODN87407.1 hypothetical protein L198_07031 [Cryptococcus wingfieldii CBS 7118]
MDYAQHQLNMLAHHLPSQMVPNTQQQPAPTTVMTKPERYYLGGAYLRPSYPGMGLGPMYIGRYHPNIGYVPSNGMMMGGHGMSNWCPGGGMYGSFGMGYRGYGGVVDPMGTYPFGY